MLKKIILIVIPILVILVGYFVNSTIVPLLSLLSIFLSKGMCSNVFVSGRSLEEVVNTEYGGIFHLFKREVDHKDMSITVSIMGRFFHKKAFYREGLGCVLFHGDDDDENMLRRQQEMLLDDEKIEGESLENNLEKIKWPIGDLISDEIIPDGSIDIDGIRKIAKSTFIGDDYIENESTRAILVLYKNQIIAEEYKSPFITRDTKLTGWSMAKSFLNTWMGNLVMNGKISMDDKVPIPDWKNDDRSKITFDDLLTMRSGLHFYEDYVDAKSDTYRMLLFEKCAGCFAFKKDLEAQPKEKWYYSSGTPNILSWYLKTLLGEKEYLNYPRRLFNKLGMKSAVLETDQSGTFVISALMYATARDYARFGLLYYNDGYNFKGEKILPEGWVDYTRTLTPFSDHKTYGSYGAHFWVNQQVNETTPRKLPDVPKDTYAAIGLQGQRVFIIPSKDLVVVRLALDSTENFDFNKFLSDIVANVKN